MEHFISLTVETKDDKDTLPKLWFKVLAAILPGLPTTMQIGENIARMRKTTKDDKITLSVPLVRNLTANEVEDTINALHAEVDFDFTVSSSRIQLGAKDEVEVEVDYAPLLNLCTAWAKEQHDEWMKDKVDAGWRYGPSVSATNKTHPLLRPWADLPDAYRKVDTSKAEQFLKLLNDHGYVMIAQTELDQMMRDESLR